jgi:transcriptional regulator with XRE-family HTH domain
MNAMPISERAADRGARRGRQLRTKVVSEFINTRIGHGVSQRELARQVRMSHTKVRRVEAGQAELSIELAARLAAVLGLELNVSVHPDGEPVRDKAHLALLERIRRRVPHEIRWGTEVPMPIAGDRRSADAVIEGAAMAAMVEAETYLGDIQALERGISAKQRDLQIARVILLVADTRHNRHVIANVPELTRRFPIATRACLAALTRGRDPGGDCLLVL